MRCMLMATRNHTKYLLLGPVFRQHGFEVVTLRDLGLDSALEAEEGRTPAENALAKARRYHSPAYPWVFGQDAGLEIDALGGEPGLQVRRWGGRFADDVDDRTWLDYLLEQMKEVPAERRTACFVDARAIVAPDGSEHVRCFRYPFVIATEPLRPIPPGAPASAVMVGPEDMLAERAAEMSRQFEAWGILAELVARFPE